MISGAHVLLYSTNADADRAFLDEVLGMRSVDAGSGWLIFALPPAELAVHPSSESQTQSGDARSMKTELYLMCDDVRSVVEALEVMNVRCTPVAVERWGMRTTIVLPSGGELGLYQPTHVTAIS